MKSSRRNLIARFVPVLRFPDRLESACLVIVAFAAGLNGAGCAPDESCAETATCPHADGGQRDGDETGAGDAKSEAGTVGDVLDASPGIDRSDRDAPAQDRAVPGTDAPSEAGAAIDARRNDVANNDGPSKIDIGVLDAAIDQRMPEPDSGGGGWDGSVVDVSRIDASEGGATGGPEGGDAPSVDVRDACVTNGCGGCTTLPNVPGTSCGACGTYACNGHDAVTCSDPGLNACGGCAVLPGAPRSSCGSCGSYACNGLDSVTCIDPGLNACAGCGVLAGIPGASCGSCGQYVCAADKASVVCDHADFVPVTQLTVGLRHSCVLLSSGSVRCWGLNDFGQLGDNSTINRSSPTVDVLTDVMSIAAGGYHTCAVRKSGGVRCWGYNALGQLGDGSTDSRSTPPSVDIPSLSSVTSMSVGPYHSCAISSGNARCWGNNGHGQLGDMSNTDRLSPGPAILTSASGLATGFFHSCAQTLGIARCWGGNADGQLGDGSQTTQNVPNYVTSLSGVSVLSAGGSHTCAIAMGSVFCWGDNNHGQLGDPTMVDRATPGAAIVNSAVTIASGVEHVCAIRGGGEVRCWGANAYGQLGDGSRADNADANGPAILDGATAVAAGWDHSCALLASGRVKCWGGNAEGQVGDGSGMDQLAPVELPGFCP